MNNTKTFGLALSGGGVRAAAFHLGVFEKLFELKLIDKIDVISTVSGGSILGVYYLTKMDNFEEFKGLMIENLKKSIELKIIFNWKIIFAIFNPNYSRTNVKSSVYDQIYYSKKRFRDLPSTPKIIINATDIATGKNWKFSQEYMGDWKIGYDGDVKNFRLADAVAASSAVPGIFHPLKIRVDKYFKNPKFNIKRIGLCDGGVYDNQGTHSLISNYDRNKRCDYIICSDASFPFDDAPNRVSLRLINVLRRQSNIMMARIKNMQFQELIYGDLKDKIETAYFSINWTIDNLLKSFIVQEDLSKRLNIWEYVAEFKGRDYKNISNSEFRIVKNKIINKLNYTEFNDYLSEKDVLEISSIGTRLYALNDYQINSLIKHGSTLCGFQVKNYLHELISK